jgi:hypothetical protein
MSMVKDSGDVLNLCPGGGNIRFATLQRRIKIVASLERLGETDQNPELVPELIRIEKLNRRAH